MISSEKNGGHIAILSATFFIAAGFLLNYFLPLSFFLGTSVYLGSFFGFMALLFLGPAVGVAALVSAALGAAARGDLGYLAVSLIEAAAAAAYQRRSGRNLAFADAMFWPVLGLWIVAAARIAEGRPFADAVLSGSTIAVFAIFSATFASLIADYARRLPIAWGNASARGRRADVPFRRIVFELSCASAIAPFVMFIGMTSWSRISGLEYEVGKRLDSLAQSYSGVAPLMLESKREPLAAIRLTASSGASGAALRGMLANLKGTLPDIVSIGVVDAAGRIEAVDADPERRPADRPGADMSSVRAYRDALSSAALSISVEKDSRGLPLICAVLPFLGAQGGGAAFSISGTGSIRSLLAGIAEPTRCRGWLVSPDGAAVAASDPGDADGFRRAIRVERGSAPRLNGRSADIAGASFAQFADAALGPGWTVAFVQDIAPLRSPVIGFALSLSAFALASIVLIVFAAAFASRLVVSSLESLGEATRRFKERFLDRESEPLAEGSGPPIAWPEEGVQEVVVLSRAFKDAGELLDRRYRETLAALGAAERADRAKRDLLAAVGHDIRGPIGGLVGVAQDLEKELGGGRAAADARLIKETGAQLAAFVEELLDRSALEDGRLELRSEPFDSRALFAGAVSVFHAAALRKGISLDYSFDERIPARLLGDRARLFQVLGNLIGNAVKYTSAGSVKVSASLLERSGGEAVILFEVSDTGSGIPPEELGRVFDPYFRGGAGAARAEKGSGIGLALARGLVRLMGSDILVESALGAGSAFRFSLRLAAPEDPARAEPEPAPPGGEPGIGARVLVVDDIEIGRRHARRILELGGCAVEEAVDGPEAVEAALGSDFDLILMDINLPSLDGGSAARAIRSGLAGRGTERPPLMIAFTAYPVAGDEADLAGSGFDGFIAKTGEAGPLLAAARRAAERGGARAAPGAPAPPGAVPNPVGGAEAAASADRAIDLQGLLGAYKGNREFLITLLRAFVSDAAERMGDLRRRLAAGDMAGAVKALHSLVNIAGAARAERALTKLRAWESALRSGRAASGAASGDMESAALEAVERAIEEASFHLEALITEAGSGQEPHGPVHGAGGGAPA